MLFFGSLVPNIHGTNRTLQQGRADDYVLLNYGLLFLFSSILIYPLLTHGFGFDLKTCQVPCSSCGLTRDMYGMLVYQDFHSINPKSPTFLVLILGQVASRFCVAILQMNNAIVWILDFLFTALTLVAIFFLFHQNTIT